MTDKQLEDGLEALVDITSLQRVLYALAQVAVNKSVHIQQNWQDKPMARVWNSIGNQIDDLGTRIGKKLKATEGSADVLCPIVHLSVDDRCGLI